MAALQHHWKTLSVSLADAILTISMNRPKVNALGPDLLSELTQAFDHASKDNTVKGVLLRSNFSSTFCPGLDLTYMHTICSARNRPELDKFIFGTVTSGITAPLRCSKPVACSVDGHAIAGGLILALGCDYIGIGKRKQFFVGLTELAVGVPFPSIPLKIAKHQMEPSFAHRLVIDANLISSNDFANRYESSETPDDMSRKWLKMVCERPLEGFTVTKAKWWADILRAIAATDNEQEKQQYFETITSDSCVQAIKNTLKK